MNMLPLLQPLCCDPDTPPMPREAAEEVANAFKALADPTRVAIVNRLSTTSEVCVCDLTAAFDLSQPTISHHLRVLRDAGLVEVDRRRTWAYYRLVPEAIGRLGEVLGARGAEAPVRREPADVQAHAGRTPPSRRANNRV